MPKEGRIVGRKLLDYSLGLYAAPAYLDRAPKIVSRGDLPGHRFVGYIEELLFTPERKGVSPANLQLFHHAYPSCRRQWATMLALPIRSRSAIQPSVIVVSARNRRAIRTLRRAPLRWRFNSASSHPNRSSSSLIQPFGLLLR